MVRTKTGGNCMQNPSDTEATYDGHKGPGYSGRKGTRTSLEWGSVARDSGLKTVAARSQPGIRNPNSTAPRT